MTKAIRGLSEGYHEGYNEGYKGLFTYMNVISLLFKIRQSYFGSALSRVALK